MASSSARLQDDLRSTKEELTKVIEQIQTMQKRKRALEEKVSSIKSQLDILSTSGSATTRYEKDTFHWSGKMLSTLKSVFKIDNFRSHQKAAINVTMNNLDCILIMPTGGGKSLCFQLPSLLSAGVTLVVSPLISLMEDQLQAMNQIGIPTAIFNSTTTREQTKYIFDSMIDAKSTLKLLYVTPEKLAKYKRLMSQLEKMYRMNRFARLVIDEVHCCSQWGHDFRPDYKFLGIMKTQYPKTPIIGLTATATPNVIVDVQEILNIEGCLVFKDSFFRSNLKYEIWDCTSETSKVQDIASVIKSRFSKQSGIVYCLTVKECEQVAKELRSFKIRAEHYHAQMESEDRSEVQQRWYTGRECHVICATIAFGMGINKLNVRFVIHHSLSKSVENYYQETGRAGRDGELAHCILFYKFSDVFKVSQVMVTEKNGVSNVYNMLKYSMDRKNCRKMLLAQHFADEWELSGCGEMCDNCERKSCEAENKFITINAGPLLDDIDKILDHSTHLEERMTLLKLMDSWLGKGKVQLRVEGVAIPKYDRQTLEAIIANLLLDDYLKEEFHFTSYATISYIVAGAKVVLRNNGRLDKDIFYEIPRNLTRSTRGKRKAVAETPSPPQSQSQCSQHLNGLSTSLLNSLNLTTDSPPSSSSPSAVIGSYSTCERRNASQPVISSFPSTFASSFNSIQSGSTGYEFSTKSRSQQDKSASINSFPSSSTLCPKTRSPDLSISTYSDSPIRKSRSPNPSIHSFSSDTECPEPIPSINSFSSSVPKKLSSTNPGIISSISSSSSGSKKPPKKSANDGSSSRHSKSRVSSLKKKKKDDSQKSTNKGKSKQGPARKKSKRSESRHKSDGTDEDDFNILSYESSEDSDRHGGRRDVIHID